MSSHLSHPTHWLLHRAPATGSRIACQKRAAPLPMSRSIPKRWSSSQPASSPVKPTVPVNVLTPSTCSANWIGAPVCHRRGCLPERGCRMNRRSTPEADAQRAIVQALRFALPRDAIVHNCANEVTGPGSRGQIRQSILVARACMRALPT